VRAPLLPFPASGAFLLPLDINLNIPYVYPTQLTFMHLENYMTDSTDAPELPKLSIFDLYATSEEDAENGKWFELSPTISVKLRRFKSKKSRKVRERLEAPYKRTTRNGELPQEVLERILTEQMAEAIIVDWKGFTDKSGNLLSYSKEQALALLTALPELRDDLAAMSIKLDNFRDEDKEETEGN